MAKRKLSDEPDILFVHEAPGSDVTKTISVKIKDFTKKMDDLENNKKPIDSPKFTMASKELYIKVCPGGYPGPHNSGKFISVYLSHQCKESISVTANLKAAGVNGNCKNQEINVGQMAGFHEFVSHVDFRKWAKENEDVFSLEATVTLHIQGASHWTTER